MGTVASARCGVRVASGVQSSNPVHSAALEPFYGGGSLTEGPGLHLTLAREVIDRHGGELSLSSDERGNRLEAILPPAPDGTRAALVDKPGR